MTDAKTRAEARRQAILSKGSSRLAKLTSSARGEDAANIYDEPPPQAPSSREPSPLIPAPPHATPLLVSSPRVVDIPPNAPLTFTSPMSSMNDGPQVTAQDPTSILFSMLGDSSMNTPVPILTPPSTSTRTSPPTLPWVFAPVRMVSVTLLVFFFVFWLEPRRYDAIDIHEPPGWERWSLLARSPTDSISVQPLPLLWTLLTLQTTIYALQLVLDPRVTLPPALLGLVLPHLPKHIAAALRNGFAYMQIGNFLLDDLSLAIFIVGTVVWASGK